MKTYATMWITRFISALLLIFLALPGWVYAVEGPRGYEPELTRPELGEPFSGKAVVCAILNPGVYVETRNKASLRDFELLYRIDTDSPIVTGWETLVMNYDQSLKSGNGKSWGTLVLEPDAYIVEPDVYSATLEEDFSVKAKKFVWYISGTYIGTGDLEGYEIDYVSTPGDIGSVSPTTCSDYGYGPVMGVDDLNGHIYEP